MSPGGPREVAYLGRQGTPGPSERGPARRELGDPIPPGTAEEALAALEAERGPPEPTALERLTLELEAAEATRLALEADPTRLAEGHARLTRLAVVEALTAEATRTKRFTGWTLREVWALWLATGLNALGRLEGTRHLDKVLLRAAHLGRDPADPPTLGRSNRAGPRGEHTYWVPRFPPTFLEGTGWAWRKPKASASGRPRVASPPDSLGGSQGRGSGAGSGRGGGSKRKRGQGSGRLG